MLSDFKYAAHQLLKSPGFAFVSFLTLALGIGVSVATFSLINAILLRPLAYAEPQSLVDLTQRSEAASAPVSGGIYLDWKEHAASFESIASAHAIEYSLTNVANTTNLHGLEVTANFLSTLGLKPALGENFDPSVELQGGDPQVVILSDAVWRELFKADPAIVGKQIRLNYQPHRVIGVLPPRALHYRRVDFLVPAALMPETWKASRKFDYIVSVVGRLRNGVSLAEAQDELNDLKRRLGDDYPEMMKAWTVVAVPLQEALFGSARPFLVGIFTAVGLVLVIACANVSNLLLARVMSRQGELSIRASVGATRWTLIRQLICESSLLAIGGGLLGLLLGLHSLDILAWFVSIEAIHPNLSLEVDHRVLLFAAASIVFTALLSGTLPAIATSQRRIGQDLRRNDRNTAGSIGRRFQSALIASEIAIAFALLVFAGLLGKSFFKATQSEPGFSHAGVLAFDLARSTTKAGDARQFVGFAQNVLDALATVPGVEKTAMVSSVPMNNRQYYGAPVWRADQPDTANEFHPGFDSIYGDYFAVMQIPMLAGRVFSPEEQTEGGAPALIIDRLVAEQLFPETDPIGETLVFQDSEWTIVGVCESVRRYALDVEPTPMVYQPMIQWPWHSSYVARVDGDPEDKFEAIRTAIAEIDPDQPIDRMRALDDSLEATLVGRAIVARLITVFGLMAAVLAGVGIYGLASFMAQQQRRELSIRLALGAPPKSVFLAVFRRGVALCGIGLIVGLIAVGIGGSVIEFSLYRVNYYDFWVLSAVAASLLLLSLAACWRPARSVSQDQPGVALRFQ